jgi:hypothetical protein
MAGSRVSQPGASRGFHRRTAREEGKDARMCIPRVLGVGIFSGLGEELALREGVYHQYR